MTTIAMSINRKKEGVIHLYLQQLKCPYATRQLKKLEPLSPSISSFFLVMHSETVFLSNTSIGADDLIPVIMDT